MIIRKASQPGNYSALLKLLEVEREHVAPPRLCLGTLRLQLSIRRALKEMTA